ncbi:MAG TPA: presqualene diphosphate synthase HpnD [Candidatus Binataceae bacterium]|nr:presqualene diphosphate synthase HpnD [Candidatus Binataceae bacterium]
MAELKPDNRLGNGARSLSGSQLDADYARCAEITRAATSNFYYAFMLLPTERRRALNAVYAFCRFIDDIADEGSIREPALLLARWREELNQVYGGKPTRAISRALADAARRFNIPRECFDEFITGVEMDLVRKRYATFDELKVYCHGVASTVGLMCIEIFGYSNPAAKRYAQDLGIAFQLTNILRDVKEDAERGRIYLPLEDLSRFGVTEEEILGGVYSPNFARLMEFEANRAREYYERAERALPAEDRSTLLTAEAMRLIYGSLLNLIVNSKYRVLDRRLSLSVPYKLYLVGRAWAATRLGALRG